MYRIQHTIVATPNVIRTRCATWVPTEDSTHASQMYMFSVGNIERQYLYSMQHIRKQTFILPRPEVLAAKIVLKIDTDKAGGLERYINLARAVNLTRKIAHRGTTHT